MFQLCLFKINVTYNSLHQWFSDLYGSVTTLTNNGLLPPTNLTSNRLFYGSSNNNVHYLNMFDSNQSFVKLVQKNNYGFVFLFREENSVVITPHRLFIFMPSMLDDG